MGGVLPGRTQGSPHGEVRTLGFSCGVGGALGLRHLGSLWGEVMVRARGGSSDTRVVGVPETRVLWEYVAGKGESRGWELGHRGSL